MPTESPSSAVSTTLRPWQADWKNPEWKVSTSNNHKKAQKEDGDDDDDDDHDEKQFHSQKGRRQQQQQHEVIVGTTSAKISSMELPDEILEQIQKQQQEKQAAATAAQSKEEEKDSSSNKNDDEKEGSDDNDDDTHSESFEDHLHSNNMYILTVTLVASSSTRSKKNAAAPIRPPVVASEVILEILQETTLQVVYTKRLLWPETIMNMKQRQEQQATNTDNDADSASLTTSSVTTFWQDLILADWWPTFHKSKDNDDDDDDDEDDANDSKNPNKKNPNGLVSAILCRTVQPQPNQQQQTNTKRDSIFHAFVEQQQQQQQQQTNPSLDTDNPYRRGNKMKLQLQSTAADDALDAIAWMGLGMETPMVLMNNNNNNNNIEKGNNKTIINTTNDTTTAVAGGASAVGATTATTTAMDTPTTNDAAIGTDGTAVATIVQENSKDPTETITSNDKTNKNEKNDYENDDYVYKKQHDHDGEGNEYIDDDYDDDDVPAQLFLACVTPNGFVAIYSPWDLLISPSSSSSRKSQETITTSKPKNSTILSSIFGMGIGSNDDDNSSNLRRRRQSYNDDDDLMHHAMTNLFLGSDLYTTLQTKWKPLCRPKFSTTLSILESTTTNTTTGKSKKGKDSKKKKKKITTTITTKKGKGETKTTTTTTVLNDADDKEKVLAGKSAPGENNDDDNDEKNKEQAKNKTKKTTAPTAIDTTLRSEETFTNTKTKTTTKTTVKKKKKKSSSSNIFFDETLWNPLLEPWTIQYRTTHENHVESIHTAGKYLILLGKGYQKVLETMTTTTTTTTTVIVDENDDDDDEKGDTTKKLASNEDRPWWESSTDDGDWPQPKDIDEDEDDDDDDDDGNVQEDEENDKAPSSGRVPPDEDSPSNISADDFPDFTHGDLTTERPWWAGSTEIPTNDDAEQQQQQQQQQDDSQYGGGGGTTKKNTTSKKKSKKSKKKSKKSKKKRKSNDNEKKKTGHDDQQPTETTETTTIKETIETIKEGGFISFCSMMHWSETRTLFLPFVPKSVSYIANWQSMELVLVMGDHDAWAIRLDVSFHPVPIGEVRLSATNSTAAVANTDDGLVVRDPQQQQQQPGLWVRRFQALPVHLPSQDKQQSSRESSSKKNNDSASTEEGPVSRLLCGSADLVQPPALMELYTDDMADGMGGLVLLKTFYALSSNGRIEMAHAPGHIAKIPEDNASLMLSRTCAYIGQGWSLFVTSNCIYWICWEGATASRGVAFVEAYKDHALAGVVSLLPASPKDGNIEPFHNLGCFVSNVLPLEGSSMQLRRSNQRSRSMSIRLPFSEPYPRASFSGVGGENPADDIVVEALESISTFTYRGDDLLTPDPASSSFIDRKISKSYSHREKSERLLRQCSSWAQLESTRDNRLIFEQQFPVLSLRFGTTSEPYRMMTLRQLTVQNGPASPFQQVLSWLCNRGDYFTAASIALDLLNDPESLYHLWKHAEKIDEEDEQNKLDGLLDGIIPIKTLGGDEQDEKPPTAPILVQLADMTVGCLTKGGLAMSKTLIKFLQNDKNYDPARACLMLAATAANTVSGDTASIRDSMGEDVDSQQIETLLWPVECMLQIGVSRDYLSTCLVLLNVTIPDELRRRPRQGIAKVSIPPMELTRSLVSLILTCDHPDAMSLLLGLVDDQSRGRYWQSLDHETQLVLSLIGTNKRYPLLKEAEVRLWVRDELHKVLTNSAEEVNIPTDWLRDLTVACLHNAGCDLPDFILDPGTGSVPSESSTAADNGGGDDDDDDDDGLEKHKIEIVETRNALISGEGALDFDLLVPCLLLLHQRRALWRGDGEYVPTQSLLDAVCYLAGRDGQLYYYNDEPLFDPPTVMRQCALAGNVRAAANLVGGTNGFVLSCCDILMVEMQITMKDAENFILNDSITLDIVENSKPYHPTTFELTDSHKELLWMLDEHVLSIRTFGEFDTTHLRGKVDPVFCSRSILRSWFCLTHSVREQGSEWLVKWLRNRLNIRQRNANDPASFASPYRLACSALTRALMWPSQPGMSAKDAFESGQMLGKLLGLDIKFLLELSYSCFGMVEAVPEEIAEEMLKLNKTSSNGGGEEFSVPRKNNALLSL